LRRMQSEKIGNIRQRTRLVLSASWAARSKSLDATRRGAPCAQYILLRSCEGALELGSNSQLGSSFASQYLNTSATEALGLMRQRQRRWF
jgi:hypothetical protein